MNILICDYDKAILSSKNSKLRFRNTKLTKTRKKINFLVFYIANIKNTSY